MEIFSQIKKKKSYFDEVLILENTAGRKYTF